LERKTDEDDQMSNVILENIRLNRIIEIRQLIDEAMSDIPVGKDPDQTLLQSLKHAEKYLSISLFLLEAK
jgi:hypothetical protein